MGQGNRQRAEKNFGNFDLWLEQVLAPAGVQAPPTSEYRLLLGVQIGKNTTTQKFLIPMANLHSLDVEKHASGCIYSTDEEKKAAVAYIREQASLFLQRESAVPYYPSSGWYRAADGTLAFCVGNEVLTASPVDEQQPPWILPSSRTHLAKTGIDDIGEMASQFLQSLWTHPQYRIPAYSYTIFASMRSLWKEVDLPFAAALFIVGKSNTGKSTLAKNFCQLYDDEFGEIADFWDTKSTKASLVDSLYKARDRTVLYDDVCKSSNRAEQRTRLDNAVEMLRYSANESVRGKKSGNQSVHQFCQAGLVLTSEILPSEWSELTRCVLISIETSRIGGTSKDRTLAAGMLRAYLRWFAQNGESELASLRQQQSTFTTDQYPGFERLYTSMVQLNWCFESFWRFLQTIPSCRWNLNSELIEEVDGIYGNLFRKEMELIQSLEQSKLSIEQHIFNGIKLKLIPFKVHKGYFCVRFDTLMTFLRQAMRNPALSARTVSTYLREHQLVDTDASERVSKKIGGKRFVCLRAQQLN